MKNNLDAAVLGDCSADDVRRTMERLTQYVIDLPHQPVAMDWRAGQISQFANDLPEQGEGIDATLEFFEQTVAPGLLRWNNPGFMGFFGASAPLPTLAANVLNTAHNSNRMVKAANPAAVELDALAGRWFQKFLNVDDAFEAQWFYSASQSHMHALGAALNRRSGGVFRRGGLGAIGAHFRIYKSEQAHFFTDKNAIITGIGLDNVVNIAVDAGGAMDPAALDAAIGADLVQGFTPLMVVATVGTTSANAVDPVAPIADICNRRGLFLYIDAAYAGAFAALPEFAWVRAGWDRADAICINPHKQLMTPLGCSLLFLRDRNELRRTFAHGGAYIPAHAEDEPDPMDFTALCGMPMNSLAPVFLMKTFGAEGMRARLRNTVRLAQVFADLIDADPAFEIVASHPFTTICFRAKPQHVRHPAALDDFNSHVAQRVMRSGSVFLSPTKLKGRTALRLTVGNINTGDSNIWAAYDIVRQSVEMVGSLLSFRLMTPPSSKDATFWRRHGKPLVDRSTRVSNKSAA